MKAENPAPGPGFLVNLETDGYRLPSALARLRSAGARGHACRHAGGGQDLGVGADRHHRGRIVAWRGTAGKPPAHSPLTTGVTDTRTLTRLPGS